MANTHVCNQCNLAIVNNPNEKCKTCLADLHKIFKDYLKKNVEVQVEIDNGQTNGYIDVKVMLTVDGEEIDSGHNYTWLHL